MQEVTKTVTIQKIPFKELSLDEQNLLKKACEVRAHAQAPYSNYYVGVAILTSKGTVHVGCNVERCTYTQTTHAEQNAIDSMIAQQGPIKVEKIAVVGAHKDISISLTNPTQESLTNVVCGHCLQIIWENCFQDPHVKILSLESDGIVACSTIADLLPFRFGPGNLNIFY